MQTMEDELQNKFTKTEELQGQFQDEKERMAAIKKFLSVYKNGLAKQVTYHNMKHDTKKN